MIRRTSSSQAEAAKVAVGERIYSINTKKFTGEGGKVKSCMPSGSNGSPPKTAATRR
jgi:hypothetical protein